MICAFALLLPGLGESWVLDSTQTLRCALDSQHYLRDYSENGVMVKRLGNAGLVLGFVVVLSILAGGYIRRMLGLYLWGSRDFPRKWQKLLLAKMIGRTTLTDSQLIEAKQRFADRPSGRLIRLLVLVIPDGFARSFMFEIAWLIFYFAFGLAQVTYYLRSSGSWRDTISFEPRFGQLLPILLLMLPLLAVLEGYSGKEP
jgi:hypothetical protein